MATDFFSQLYFGNTVLQYLFFIVTIGVFVIIGKIVNYVAKGVGRRLTAKSKTKLDDVLLDMIEEPVVFLIVVVGFVVGFQFLTFSDFVTGVFYNGVSVAVTLIVAWALTRIVDALMSEFVRPLVSKTDTRLDDQIIPLISKIAKVAIWAIAIIMILNNFGYDVTALLAGLGIGGLAFAFAAKETISDAFGGISILTSKPFIVGDFVEIGSVKGTVEEVGLRFTRIRNLDKRLVTMPNSNVAKATIINYSSAPKRKIVLDLGLTYNTTVKKMHKAMELVKEIVNKRDDCEKDPLVVFTEFKDSSINLMVIYYITDKDNWLRIRSEVGLAIKEAFDKNKIEFAFPTQTIYLEK